MTTTQITVVTALLTSLLALIPLSVTAWTKLQEAMAPYLRRRRLPVGVLVGPSQDGAGAFCAGLRKQGYCDVCLLADVDALAGRDVVVVWHPDQDAAVVAQVQATYPEATILVLTHLRISVTLGERTLLSNSQVRLRSDLASVAEAV